MGNLVLTVKCGERVKIGNGWARVVRVGPNQARLAFEFPKDVPILREILLDKTEDNHPIKG